MSEEEDALTGEWFIDALEDAETSEEYITPLFRRVQAAELAFDQIRSVLEDLHEQKTEASSRLENIRAIVASETEFEPESGVEAMDLAIEGKIPADTMRAIHKQNGHLKIAIQDFERDAPTSDELRTALFEETQAFKIITHNGRGIPKSQLDALIESYDSMWVTCFDGVDRLPIEGIFYTFGPIERIIPSHEQAIHQLNVSRDSDI